MLFTFESVHQLYFTTSKVTGSTKNLQLSSSRFITFNLLSVGSNKKLNIIKKSSRTKAFWVKKVYEFGVVEVNGPPTQQVVML